MWQSANSPFIVIGDSNSKRVQGFQTTLAELDLPVAQVVSYESIIRGETHLGEVITSDSILRLESPDRNFELEKMVLELGATIPDTYHQIENTHALSFDKGRIIAPRQWYLGFCRLLEMIQAQRAEAAPHQIMNHPAEIALMFDKVACHNKLICKGFAVPQSIGVPQFWEDCQRLMEEVGLSRLFLKLAHGSSASGVVAYRTNGYNLQAITTVDIQESSNGQIELYNTRKLRTLTQGEQIMQLIDALCCHRLFGQAWIPKASLEGGCFDLRVIVVNGKVQHAIARLSASPITNLHLLNERLPIEAVLAHLPERIWAEICETCESAMQTCFPESLYAGFDIMVSTGMNHFYILEVNAFGDFIKDQEVYRSEILAALERR